jgi:HlyD family secretion protein
VKLAQITSIGRLAIVGVLVVGCSAPGGGPPAGQTNPGGPPATAITVAQAKTGSISQTAQYPGTVQPAQMVNVVPQITGQIVKLDVDVGSSVHQGDVLAELDKTNLQEQVAQAEAGVEAAQIKVNQVMAPGRPETVAQAQANLQTAQAKLAAIQGQGRPESVGQASANLTAAQAKLAGIQNGARPESVATAKANLDAAQAKLKQLLDGPTPDQVAAAQLQLEQAKNALTASQANKDGQCNPKNPQYLCETAQASANAAQTAVSVAAQNLKTLTDPPTQDAINQAQAAVDAAQQQYQLAQKPYVATDVAQAQAAVNAAQQQVNLAQTPYTANDLAQAQAAVDAAQAQVALAKNPYTDLDVQAANVTLKQAQAVLAIAQTNLKEADVVAPFDGMISARLLAPGALASPQTPIFTLNSIQSQIQFAIEQARVGAVQVGQAVNLTTSAFPDKTFPGKVTSIYPSADPKTHTFTIAVQSQDQTGALRPGMFVNLVLTVASAASATLVPSVAVIQRGSQSVVFIVNAGKVKLQPVTLGIADDTNTQILTGVNPGDTVVTSNQSNLNDGSPVRVVTPGNPAGGQGGQSGRGQPGGTPQPTAGAGQQGRGATPTPAG